MYGFLKAVPPTLNPSAAIEGVSVSGSIVFQPENTFTVSNISDGIATLSGGVLSGLLPPTNPSDATNKQYVDAFINVPTSWKNSVKAATTGNITLAGNQVVDFVTLFTGDRVLVKNQTIGLQNGIYDVDTLGTWTRSFDMLDGSSAAASAVFVQNGLVNGTIGFLCTNNTGLDIVGTNTLAFISFSGNSLNAGIGLSRVGDTLNTNLDNSSVGVTLGNVIQINDSGVTNTKISAGAVTDAKITGPIQVSKLSASTFAISTTSGIIGAAATLGNSATISLDSTVLRTSGNQSRSGTLTITDTTQSTSKTTGCLVLAGGVGVSKNLSVGSLTSTTSLAVSASANVGSLTDGTTIISGGLVSGCIEVSSLQFISGTVAITSNNIVGVDSIDGNIISATTFTDGYTTLTGGNIATTGDITSNSYLNGPLIINGGNITGALAVSCVTQTISGTVSCGTLTDGYATLNSGTLSNLFPPNNPGDATNKAYVDSLLQGLYWKQEVLAASTGNITLSGTQTIDGVALVAGNRILAKNQTNGIQNGIYIVSAGVWSRSSDMTTGSSASGTAIAVQSGTVNANSGFTCTNLPGTGVVGTDSLTFIRFVTIQTVTAGAGLTEVSNVLSVNIDNTTIDISGSNALEIKNLGVTNAKIAAGAVTDTKITGPIQISKLSQNTITISNGQGITGGSTISLGGSATIGVDSTVLRTSGNQSRSGILTITDTTQSTSTTTGCLVLNGGLGVSKNVWVGGTVTGGEITDGILLLSGGDITSAGTIGCTTLGSGTIVCGGTLTANTIGANSANIPSIGCTNLTVSNLTGLSSLTLSGTLSAGTLTDGVANLTGGVLTGITSFSTGSLTVSGSTQTNTVVATGNITAGSLTTTGATQTNTLVATGTVTSSGINTGAISSTGAINTTNTVTAATLTDGTASLSGGNLTGLNNFSTSNLTVSGNVTGNTMNTGSLTATGTITGNAVNGTSGTITSFASNQVTVGSSVLTNGKLTNLSTPISSGDAANKSYVDSKTAAVNYSTSETSLGITWIDGKTVYQKVLSMGALPSLGGSTTVNHGITNPQTWVSLSVMAKGPGSTYTTPDYGTEISANTLAVTFRARGSSWSGYTGVAILQYTKA